jgi:hypothetical protein
MRKYYIKIYQKRAFGIRINEILVDKTGILLLSYLSA